MFTDIRIIRNMKGIDVDHPISLIFLSDEWHECSDNNEILGIS